MKYPHIRFTTSLFMGALVVTGLSIASAQSTPAKPDTNKPTVVTPPAVRDGSTEIRAPFPSARQFDDAKGPNVNALENAPTSTPATDLAPPAPPSNVKITVEKPARADPGLLPTGRTNVSIAASLGSETFTLRNTTIATRDRIFTDLESRMTSAENTLSSLDKTASEMSAEGRKQFKTASDDVKEKAKALKKSVQAARKAGGQEWNEARAQLASDYEAYAAALASIDTARGLPPPPPAP